MLCEKTLCTGWSCWANRTRKALFFFYTRRALFFFSAREKEEGAAEKVYFSREKRNVGCNRNSRPCNGQKLSTA